MERVLPSPTTPEQIRETLQLLKAHNDSCIKAVAQSTFVLFCRAVFDASQNDDALRGILRSGQYDSMYELIRSDAMRTTRNSLAHDLVELRPLMVALIPHLNESQAKMTTKLLGAVETRESMSAKSSVASIGHIPPRRSS